MPKVLLFSRQPLLQRPLHEWLDDTADRVVLITTPKAVRGAEDILAEHFPMHRLVPDYHSWATEAIAEETARAHGVDLVASSSENDVLRAARLRARLGLSGQHPASATAYRDKVVMKRIAREAGIRVPEFTAVDSPADLLDFLDAVGFPAVVKPRFGAGSEGVSVLRGPRDVTDFLDRQNASDVPYLPGQWMVESFVHGDFFHVDGIMRDGRAVHCWPSRYGTEGLAGRLQDHSHLSGIMLAPDDPRFGTLTRLTHEVLAALPGSSVPLAFHLEAWTGADGEPVLCEIASRAGGALIAEAYERAFGVHLAREGLRAQCGSPLALTEQPPPPEGVCGWIILPPGRGVFVPPTKPCPVTVADFTVRLAPGAVGRGVEHLTQSAADALVTADTAARVHAYQEEIAQWWSAAADWVPTDAEPPR
ncbi:acetyl-CoA carboxylase biotin carboxylase subunit family protein [Streptomyces sp. NPDC014734]|uniref:ATP-grasp domain-containing protein n=1 Tax=Streptomyces sp. NPDC014734 TaxID=3364886 RepID=UPI003700BDA8